MSVCVRSCARNQLAFAILSQDRHAFVTSAAAHAINSHTFVSAQAAADAVEKVTVADVKAVSTCSTRSFLHLL